MEIADPGAHKASNIWVVPSSRVLVRVLSMRLPHYVGDPEEDPDLENDTDRVGLPHRPEFLAAAAAAQTGTNRNGTSSQKQWLCC